MKKNILSIAILMAASSSAIANADDSPQKDIAHEIETIKVWGESKKSTEAGYTNPTSVLHPEDMLAINAATTEDLVKYEPSIVVRRRFIGDSNGTLGLRGSNMFQTARSMVFADGVPLHYLLQTRWSGAPRWTMVSASEIEQVEVIYGPFSAEYSGNAMGGVVVIETALPESFELHADLTTFSQQFSDYGYDDTVNGYKGFVSVGGVVNDFSYYLSVNHLDNDAQPQTFRGAKPKSSELTSNVQGGESGVDSRNREQYYYGDTGVVHSETDNIKVKLGYDFGRWQALVNFAFEDRTSNNSGQSYLKDASGNTVWAGSDLVVDGQEFSFNSKAYK